MESLSSCGIVLAAVSIAAVSYLCGSVPVGYLIGRMHGIDIRTQGSGNIGATNVTRVIGSRWGKLCFFLDFFKGLAPVVLVSILTPGAVLAFLPDSWFSGAVILPDPWGIVPSVAAFAAYELPDGKVERLALDVPKRHVDGRESAHQHRPAAPVRVAVVLVPYPLRVERVAPDKRVLDVGDGAEKRVLLVLQGALADAADALVGLHLHEHPVRAVAVNGKRPDFLDLHLTPPRSLKRPRPPACAGRSSPRRR